jgi:tetratricopeptide (TPR) repeat protein
MVSLVSGLFKAAILAACLMPRGAWAETISNADRYASLIASGRIALRQEAPEAAIPHFTTALRLAPNSKLASLLLAESYLRAGQPLRAQAYLTYKLKSASDTASEDIYQTALDQLFHREPIAFSGSFALLPSTNIANTSSNTYFDTLIGRFMINDGGDAVSGIGAQSGGHVAYRYPLGDGRRFELGAGVHNTWYKEPSLRSRQVSLSADFKQIGRLTDWGAGLHHRILTYPDAPASDRTITGLHANWSRAMNDRNRLSLLGTIEQRNYRNSDALSGHYVAGGVSIAHHLASGARVSFGAEIQRSTPNLDYHRYWGGALSAEFDRSIGPTLRAGINARLAVRQYDVDFAAVDFARHDTIRQIGFSISDSRIKMFGATPKLSCRYTAQSSNIALYALNSTDCQLGWSYRF